MIPLLEKRIISWANARNLYDNVTIISQTKKLLEEISEWLDEVNANNREAEKLELGDIYVVLTNLAHSRGFKSLEDCGWIAYEKIKDRSGYIHNGSFIKDDK